MITIQDVCEKLEVNSNMAFRMLSTLVSTGFLSKDNHTDTYTVSLKSLKLSLGDNCVAAPVKTSKGKTIAAISLSALSSNMSQDELEAAIPKLKETAASITSLLGY